MLVSRNVVVAGRRTSMRLEPEMWEALEAIAQSEGFSINELVTLARSQTASSLTSAVRVMALDYFRFVAQNRNPPQRAAWVNAVMLRRERQSAPSSPSLAGARRERPVAVAVAGR